MSHRELLTVEMKRTNHPNMILELRTEHLRTSRLRRELALVIYVRVYAFSARTFGDNQCELVVM